LRYSFSEVAAISNMRKMNSLIDESIENQIVGGVKAYQVEDF